MTVRVEHLTKGFAAGLHPAVSDVGFEAPQGSITALLGPSGAGKSTVLRLIAGLEELDGGRISIDGEDCSRVPVRKRDVGFVFQSYALFDHMTVNENVAFGLRMRKLPKASIEARVKELLRLVQLEDLGARRPTQLSGGQRQRIAFARALAVRPRVLLLDEPFGALDARVRVELREWLRRLHDETRITTIMVTHDQDEAFAVARHVVLMFDGRVAQVGSPREIQDRPATAEVASFLEVPGKHGARAQPAPPGLSLGRIAAMHRKDGAVHLTVALPGERTIEVVYPGEEIEGRAISVGDPILLDLTARPEKG